MEKNISKIVSTYRNAMPDITEESVEALAKAWWEGEKKRFDKLRSDVYDEIQKRADYLEFKYAGLYNVKPFEVHKFQKENGCYTYQGVRTGEKGVDVGIATDMIAKMSAYDAAILVSGDADFQPVVRYLKDHLKYVYQFSVAKGVPPNIDYLSSYLKGMVDVFESFDEEELLSKYLKKEDGIIPRQIRREIDNKINALYSQKKSIGLDAPASRKL
ncbi:MAG: NYN domain-containing protein [Deltaproteobacteria bacterium]|nr:NYN domain-containing protein [Deltaproteobacteria bacterium]